MVEEDIVRIVLRTKPIAPCRTVLKKLEILLVLCKCVYSLMNFIVHNQENFQTNSCVLAVSTGNKHHLHRSNTSALCFKKVRSVLTSKC